MLKEGGGEDAFGQRFKDCFLRLEDSEDFAVAILRMSECIFDYVYIWSTLFFLAGRENPFFLLVSILA